MSGDERGNVAMVLTPPGAGAIAVVRICGNGVVGFLESCFSGEVKEGKCVHGELRDGQRVIDDPVVVLGNGGGCADINLHGGPWVVRSAMELARRHGFEVTERTEAPLVREAVDADSILEAEVLEHLPLARTELGLRRLLKQEELWREQIKKLGAMDVKEASGRVRMWLEDRSMYWLLHPPRVAIVGIANAGKSTLANQLFGQERSIMADLPGTTRDWVGELADINGLAVMLVDTPGVRETEDSIEREAIERSGEVVAGADLVVVVLDATVELEQQVGVMGGKRNVVYVLNKVDRGMGMDAKKLGAIETVATRGEGIDLLRCAIARHFGCDGVVERVGWWTERQRKALAGGFNEAD